MQPVKKAHKYNDYAQKVCFHISWDAFWLSLCLWPEEHLRRAKQTHWKRERERERGRACLSSSQLGQIEHSASGLAFCSKIAPSLVSSLCIIICELRRLFIFTFQVYLTEVSQLKISLGLIGHTWQDDAPTVRILWLTEWAQAKWIRLFGNILSQPIMCFSTARDSNS